MRKTFIVISLLFTLNSFAQEQFFKSSHQFSEKELEDFYSSVTISDSMVLFKGNDYYLYAYNRNTGRQIWKYYLKYKSNTKPYVIADHIWANRGESGAIRLDLDGRNPKELPFSLYSSPVHQNNMLYFTGIYEAGNIMAYDMNADSVSWFRFIAHGCDVQPYYSEKKIMANAEGDRWVELDYDGNYKNCETDEGGFPTGKDCYRDFIFLTHDGREVSEKNAYKLDLMGYGRPEIAYTSNKTLLLEDNRFVIVGKKLKKLYSVILSDLSEEIDVDNYGFASILKANDSEAWICYNERLLIFDLKRNALARVVNLEAWEPHQVIADGNNLWVISRKDGELYGLKVN